MNEKSEKAQETNSEQRRTVRKLFLCVKVFFCRYSSRSIGSRYKSLRKWRNVGSC
jgi:hypothetical protein